jgi:hypothetical protein
MKITFQEFLLKFFLLSPKNFFSKQLPIFQQDLHPGCILSIFPMTRQGKISHAPDESSPWVDPSHRECISSLLISIPYRFFQP